MIFRFRVEKVATLRHKLFVPDPEDPSNTKDSGKYIQELHLELMPDQLAGGRGMAMIQLNHAEDIGVFQPGDLVRCELTAVK